MNLFLNEIHHIVIWIAPNPHFAFFLLWKQLLLHIKQLQRYWQWAMFNYFFTGFWPSLPVLLVKQGQHHIIMLSSWHYHYFLLHPTQLYMYCWTLTDLEESLKKCMLFTIFLIMWFWLSSSYPLLKQDRI